MIASGAYFGLFPHWLVGLAIIVWVVKIVKEKLNKDKYD